MKNLSQIVFACILLALPVAALSAIVEITVNDSGFQPSSQTINVGDTVRWVNKGSSLHSVTSGANGISSGNFDSGLLNPGVTFEQTFTSQGTVSYFDFSNTTRIGSIKVTYKGVTISPRNSLLLTSQSFDLAIYVTGAFDPNDSVLTIELIYDGQTIFKDNYSTFLSLSQTHTIVTEDGSLATIFPIQPGLTYGVHSLTVTVVTQSGLKFTDNVVYTVTRQTSFLP
jgi:hypothetical protein